MLSMFLRARSAMTRALFSSAFWMATPAAEVVFLLARSWVVWRRRLRAASRRISFWRAAIRARGGVRRGSGVAGGLGSSESDLGLGVEHGESGFFVGGEGIGFGFDDLLLGFGEVGLGLLELVILLGGIELDDDIAGGDEFAGVAEGGDGHIAAANHEIG